MQITISREVITLDGRKMVLSLTGSEEELQQMIAKLNELEERCIKSLDGEVNQEEKKGDGDNRALTTHPEQLQEEKPGLNHERPNTIEDAKSLLKSFYEESNSDFRIFVNNVIAYIGCTGQKMQFLQSVINIACEKEIEKDFIGHIKRELNLDDNAFYRIYVQVARKISGKFGGRGKGLHLWLYRPQ